MTNAQLRGLVDYFFQLYPSLQSNRAIEEIGSEWWEEKVRSRSLTEKSMFITMAKKRKYLTSGK